MKKINILMASAVASLSLLATSCGDDFLDKTPKGNYTADNFYASDAAVRKGVEPLYNKAWFNFNRRALIGMGSYRANDGWNPYVSAEFANFKVTALTEDLGLAWSALYNVVTMSNGILANLENNCTSAVSESVKNSAMGECHLMRGWAYFYLLRGWGANILFESNEDIVKVPIKPLNTEADVLKFIIRDFRKAVELLPTASTDHHATRYTAKAALAKALLAQSGWDENATADHSRNEQTLQEVVTLCDEVINCGQFDLLPNYEDLFKAQNNDNVETILAMRWADPNTNEWGAMNATYSDLAFPEVSDVNVWGGNLSVSCDMLDIYNEDPADSIRRKATWFSPGSYYDYIKKADGGYTYNHNWMQCKKGVLGTKADVAPCNIAQMASPLNTYIQRLADVYLMKAEAILGNNASTSDAAAIAAFEKVHNRARIVPVSYSSITLDDIIRERRIEFCMEYFNWWDMVTWYRWKPKTMLEFFNYKQHRAFEIRENSLYKRDNGTFSYRVIPPGTGTWYLFDENGHLFWNDYLAESETDNTAVRLDEPYVYNLNELLAKYCDGFQKVELSETNIFMPYPESDVIQNKYFNEAPVSYDFTWDVED